MAYKDINYVKFWNQDNNGKLSEYSAGDYSKYTVFTMEGKTQYYNAFETMATPSRLSSIDKIYTVDGRIAAAFPGALRWESDSMFDKTSKDANKVSSYNPNNTKDGITWQNNGKGIASQKDGNTYGGTGNIVCLLSDDMYKLVDCVFEDTEKRQFVVPFVIFDAKNVHLLPNEYDIGEYISDDFPNLQGGFDFSRGGKLSNLTDGRYGQVVETVKISNISNIYIYNEVWNKTTNKWELIENKEYVSSDKYTNGVLYDDYGHSIIYFDKSEKRTPKSISPIEPLTSGSISTEKIFKALCGVESKAYRLISMRIYETPESKLANAKVETINDKRVIVAELNNNSLWDIERRKIETSTIEKEIEVQSSENHYSGILDYFNKKQTKKIVNY